MLKRPYGKTGIDLSIIGFGGIIVDNMEQAEANSYVAEAIEAGVNYFDVAPSYGSAENQLGPALKPYRNQAFLACKSTDRSFNGAKKDMENSLQRLQTDHFDLYQLHAMTTEEDFQQAMGPNGALEYVLKAKEEGKVRYIGFSAHSVEIAVKLLEAFNFDSILVPINFANWYTGSFGPQIVEKAQEKQVPVLALKAMAKQQLTTGKRTNERCWYEPLDDQEIAHLALRWTLSTPGVVAAIPPGDIKLFRIALEAIKDGFTPVTQEETKRLQEYAKDRTPVFSVGTDTKIV